MPTLQISWPVMATGGNNSCMLKNDKMERTAHIVLGSLVENVDYALLITGQQVDLTIQ